jgi:hypothetical protein
MKKGFGILVGLLLSLTACTTMPPEIKQANITKNGVTANQNYFDFFDSTLYHEIVIEVKASALDALDVVMNTAFEKYGHYRTSTYVKANFVYRENGVEKIRINEIGLRPHGNTFSRYLIEVDGKTMNSLH